MVPNPIKMDDFGVPLFLETPKSWLEVFYPDLFFLAVFVLLDSFFVVECCSWFLLVERKQCR